MKGITVIGEAVADAFVASDGEPGSVELKVRPGGGPANTAVALARLEVPTTFLGRLSGDRLGELLRGHLVQAGVDLSSAVAAAQPQTLALTSVDDEGHARYTFYADGTADWQWTAEELAVPADTSCIHTGSLALAREPGGPLIEALLRERRGGATISIDPNLRTGLVPVEDYRARLGGWTSVADLFRLSEEDLEQLRPGAQLDEVFDEWHADGVRLIVVTRGGKGAVGSYDGHRVTVPAPAVRITDTVGAGDSFTAGLLAWLYAAELLDGPLDAEALRQAMTFAAEVAAETCKMVGANPPSLAALGGKIMK